MKKIIVPVEYGLRAYFNDCESKFPHGLSKENAGCVVTSIKSALTYRCPECRKEWVKGDCNH